jgi:hypothetical protein
MYRIRLEASKIAGCSCTEFWQSGAPSDLPLPQIEQHVEYRYFNGVTTDALQRIPKG